MYFQLRLFVKANNTSKSKPAVGKKLKKKRANIVMAIIRIMYLMLLDIASLAIISTIPSIKLKIIVLYIVQYIRYSQN